MCKITSFYLTNLRNYLREELSKLTAKINSCAVHKSIISKIIQRDFYLHFRILIGKMTKIIKNDSRV